MIGTRPEAIKLGPLARALTAHGLVPTLILTWDTDPSHPVETAHRLAEVVPGSQLHISTHADDVAGWGERAAEFLGTLKERPAAKVPTKSLFELAGDGAKGVAPALEKLLTDENVEVKLAAARADRPIDTIVVAARQNFRHIWSLAIDTKPVGARRTRGLFLAAGPDEQRAEFQPR